MFHPTLPLVFVLVTSCLAAPDTPQKEVSPLCKDLESLVEWNTAKGTEQQYLKLKEKCSEAGDMKTGKTADAVVDRMIRCGKLEHSTDQWESTKKEELASCNLELNCYKRFYMEEAKLGRDPYPKEFPLVWHGSEVKVTSPPSEIFIDASPADQNKPSCSKFAGSAAKRLENLAALGMSPETNLEKVKGDLMKQIHKNAQATDKGTESVKTSPAPVDHQNVDLQIERLVSEIIDGIFKLMNGGLSASDFMVKDNQEQVQKVMGNMQQLSTLIANHKQDSLAASLMNMMQRGLANSNQLSPIELLVNYMFDTVSKQRSSQQEPAKAVVHPDQNEMEYYSQNIPAKQN